MYKKFFCIALFLVMLVGMTCVVASEDISADDAIANAEDLEVQSVPTDDMNDELSTNDIDGELAKTNAEKLNPNFNSDIETDNEYVRIYSTVNVNATGNVSIQITKLNDESYKLNDIVKIENGTAVWAEFISFDKGTYNTYITYLGDDNYYSTSMFKQFEIEKMRSDLKVYVTTDNAMVRIAAIANEDATGTMTFRMKTAEEENFTEYATMEMDGGVAIWADQITFAKGEYVAYVTYNGDSMYFTTSNVRTFEIKKEIPEFDTNITVNDYLIKLNATLPENATGNVTIQIKTLDEENFTEYATIDVENGTAVWSDLLPFNKGNYMALITYNGDDNYFKKTNAENFTIEKQFPSMYINSTADGMNATITVTLPENATGTVTLTNNQTGEIRNVTLNGTSIVFNETLLYGYNVFQIDYSGDDYYFGISNTVAESYQVDTSLSTKSTVEVTFRNSVKVKVKLKVSGQSGNPISNGENVTITVNNKTYTGTLTNGTTTIKIMASYNNNFIPNNYTANVTFEGTEYLKNASSSFTLVVNKGTPKLTAKAKTFKVSTKIKKYTVTLKNHKNAAIKNYKVYIKINGKTFTAKTNSKGQATFKITNLNKKAKYLAVVTYKGGKYYNGVSQKVKITVKS